MTVLCNANTNHFPCIQLREIEIHQKTCNARKAQQQNCTWQLLNIWPLAIRAQKAGKEASIRQKSIVHCLLYYAL